MSDLLRGIPAPDYGARSVFDIFVAGGFEALNRSVRRGDPIKDVRDLRVLLRLCQVFVPSVEARLRAADMLIDEADNGN